MESVFDDLLGPDLPPRYGPGRPRRGEERPRIDPLATTQLHEVVRGVSVPFLMGVFRAGRPTVERAVANLRPVSTNNNGSLMYNLAEAAAYLVKPVHDMEDYLKKIDVKDLPDHLKDSVWSAKLKEQKWRANAGNLWPSESVLEVLGETFKTIKNEMQLWVDTIDETKGLSDDQRKLLGELVDSLQSQIHTALLVQAKSGVTKSQLAELDDVSDT